MTPAVSAVRSWRPDDLRLTADHLDALVDKLDDRMKGLLTEQDVLAERWSGDAARAAAARVVRERALGSAIAEALLQVAGAYRTGAFVVEGARMHLVATVNSAEQSGFEVRDNGTVDPSAQIALIATLIPEPATAATARTQLECDAADLTHAVTHALEQATHAATETTDRINTAVAALEDARDSAVPGKVAQSEDGQFSWTPDWAATTATSTIGLMTDATKEGLETAALSAGDDLARGVARGLGPAGAALGVVPAIVNDIEGGMDPTEAIVTETTGAAIGFGAALATGAAMGSVVPGAGTAVGLAAGAIVGGFAAWGSSKFIQSMWD